MDLMMVDLMECDLVMSLVELLVFHLVGCWVMLTVSWMVELMVLKLGWLADLTVVL
jgi:hypothetical protein